MEALPGRSGTDRTGPPAPAPDNPRLIFICMLLQPPQQSEQLPSLEKAKTPPPTHTQKPQLQPPTTEIEQESLKILSSFFFSFGTVVSFNL